MQKRRVALISSSFLPYTGGVEEHTLNVARQLRDRGHVVVVWTVDRGEHLGTQAVEGITVRYLPTPLPAISVGAVARFARAFPAGWSAWREAFRLDRPDVLHVQCFGPNGVYAVLLHHRTRTPLVLSSHGETFADDHAVFTESRLLRAALGHGLHRAAAVTGCSQLVLDDLAERFGSPPGRVVHNGVDLDEAGTFVHTDKAVPGSAGPTVFAVGRVERVKGFDLLLEAFARAGLPATTRLVVGGDGQALGGLRDRAAALGVASRVDFPGQLSRAEVSHHMADSAVVVVPSRQEAFGIVVLEAWRAGTPVIATSRGGPREFVTDGMDGILVDPEDVDALAAQLHRVLADPATAKRLGQAGAVTVRDFTWAATATAYEDIYEQVIAHLGG